MPTSILKVTSYLKELHDKIKCHSYRYTADIKHKKEYDYLWRTLIDNISDNNLRNAMSSIMCTEDIESVKIKELFLYIIHNDVPLYEKNGVYFIEMFGSRYEIIKCMNPS